MNKGFTYIITVMILIMLITSLILINRPNKQPSNNASFISKNYEIEFLYLSSSNVLDENKINSFNSNYLNHINSYNYSAEICNIIETEDYIFFSNFTGESCDLVIDDEVSQVVNDKTTTKIDRFINNMNIYLCSCNYEKGKNSYYLDIYNEDIRIINKN